MELDVAESKREFDASLESLASLKVGIDWVLSCAISLNPISFSQIKTMHSHSFKPTFEYTDSFFNTSKKSSERKELNDFLP
jgi:hypothetical protein